MKTPPKILCVIMTVLLGLGFIRSVNTPINAPTGETAHLDLIQLVSEVSTFDADITPVTYAIDDLSQTIQDYQGSYWNDEDTGIDGLARNLKRFITGFSNLLSNVFVKSIRLLFNLVSSTGKIISNVLRFVLKLIGVII